MLNKEKRADILQLFEILVAAVLFFAMLICCGLYIDIKINGKTSNLPPLSETDTRLLFSSSDVEPDRTEDDLLEPVFVGVKNNRELFALDYDNDQRRLLESCVYQAVRLLFKGKSEFISCEDEDKDDIVEDLKNADKYILIGFYDDLPSDVILPLITNGFDFDTELESFFFRHLFLVSDEKGNLFGYAVSSQNDVTKLIPSENVSFNNFFDEAYDVSDRKIPFAYSQKGSITPELAVSLSVNKYLVSPYASSYGKGVDAEWLLHVFDAFSFNPNLLKSFNSGDGSETIYVEDFRELIVNDNGTVEYKDTVDSGIDIQEFISYVTPNSGEYSFKDKVFAVKSLINGVRSVGSNVSYSLIGIDYNDESDSLRFYFKYTVDGVFVFDRAYDAVFEISDNKLIYAYMCFFECTELDDAVTSVPQRYASAAMSDKHKGEAVYPVLCDYDADGIREFSWAFLNSNSEVNG